MNPRQLLDSPRYRANPSDFFFEMLVLDTVSPLSPDTVAWIAETIRCTQADWRVKVRTLLSLSNTIEIAILDLWYRNLSIAQDQKATLEPRDFALQFVDHFYEEGSQIDQWGPGALDAARKRIADKSKQ